MLSVKDDVGFVFGAMKKGQKFKVSGIDKKSPEEIKQLRGRCGLSQPLFAMALGVSVKTLESWEQGRNTPSGSAARLLEIIDMDTDIISNFIQKVE